MDHLISVSVFQKECKERNSLIFTIIFSFSISINAGYSGCLSVRSTDTFAICYVRINPKKLLDIISFICVVTF